jgi:tetratricopeptide repeat protein
MADSQRIDDLRRRVQKDPASIAFAQLAEECRRAGRFEEAVDVCRAGLDIHPGYLSARVTLGRALVELNALDEAQTELELVLKSAPENLAAIRGLAEIHHRRGSLVEALAQYRAALALARNDPDLQRTVADLEAIVEPPKPAAVDEGMSFEQAEAEFLKNLPPPPPRAAPKAKSQPGEPAPVAHPTAAEAAPDFQLGAISPQTAPEPSVEVDLPTYSAPQPEGPAVEIDLPVKTPPPPERPVEVDLPALELVKTPEPEVAMDLTETPPPFEEPSVDFGVAAVVPELMPEPVVDFDLIAPPSRPPEPSIEMDFGARIVEPAPLAAAPDYDMMSMHDEMLPVESAEDLAERERASLTLVALEQWLDAIHAVRTHRGA